MSMPAATTNAANDMSGQYTNQYPNVHVRAVASKDGQRITLFLPGEFIGAVVAFAGDNNGRHRMMIDPKYGGMDVVGFVDNQKVQMGKVEISAGLIDLKNLIPGKMTSWSAKQRDTDILLGRLFSDLVMEPVRVAQPISYDRPPPLPPEPPKIIERVVEKTTPITIEAAINFINQWVVDNRAELIVEDNALFVEVRKRLGVRPSKPVDPL